MMVLQILQLSLEIDAKKTTFYLDKFIFVVGRLQMMWLDLWIEK